MVTMCCVAVFLFGSGCKESDKEASNKSDWSPNSAAAEKGPTPTEQPAAPEPKANEIEWVYSVSEGLASAKEKGKPAFIDFYADWCPPCQQMEKVTFRDKRVIEELARFIAIKADLTNSSSKGQSAAKEYGVQAIPTYVFISTQGKQTTELGYRSPDKFIQILKSTK